MKSIAFFHLMLVGCWLSPTQAQSPHSFWAHPLWNDGQAELAIYQAQEVRYGTPQPTQVLSILVSERFSGQELVKADDWRAEGSYPVIKWNDALHITTGSYVYQQMFSSFRRLDRWQNATPWLVKMSVTSNDSCGNSFHLGERLPSEQWRSRSWTYWEGMSETEERHELAGDAVFYEELPLLARQLVFDHLQHDGPIEGNWSVGPQAITSRSLRPVFKPAVWRMAKTDDTWQVIFTREGQGEDKLIVQAGWPHLLLGWHKADGGSRILEHALRLPYWEYQQPGDLDRALATESYRLYPAP